MRPLTNVVRSYAWGSRTAIASLQRRRVPSERPEAELWLGAHPSAPSMLGEEDGCASLTDVIARDPVAALGSSVAGRFGSRLPYLLKVLAAEQPLSLQAHPDAEQARAGFAAESRLAPDPAARNYVDPYHKPELLVAVEPFDALVGFRAPEKSAQLLRSFGVAALTPVVDALLTGSVEHRLRAATRLLLDWPQAERERLVREVTSAGERLASRAECSVAAASPPPDVRAVHQLAVGLGRRYPADIGVIIALLLNQVRLGPDEAIFTPTGSLHAYLRGLAVEVMAASDNVLRGGLTGKRVDPDELRRVVRYQVFTDLVRRPVRLAEGVLTWPAPVAEFRLVKAVAQAEPVALPGGGPRIVLCLCGAARLTTGRDSRVIAAGEAVFIAADEPAVRLERIEPAGAPSGPAGAGPAVVFQVSVGDPPVGAPPVGDVSVGDVSVGGEAVAETRHSAVNHTDLP